MLENIIVTYHKNKDMLLYVVGRLLETTSENVEIVIIGNNVNRSELDFEIPYSRCHYYQIYDNIQYPKAINLGVSYCEGELITFVDADVFPQKGWYDALKTKFNSSEKIGAVGAKLVNPQNNRILDYGIAYTYYNGTHPMMGLPVNHPLASFDYKFQAVCSAILMTSKSLFLKCGGMDEELPYLYTDCDYCMRLRDNGYESWVCSTSIAYHKGNTSPNNSKSDFSYLKHDARGIFAMKRFPTIINDFWEWFEKSAGYFLSTHTLFCREYVLLNYSTTYERTKYYDYIENLLNIKLLDKVELPEITRDVNHIILYDKMPFSYIDMSMSIVFFVDRFTALFNNSMIYCLRNISNDIVIDRHGNIATLLEIASGQI